MSKHKTPPRIFHYLPNSNTIFLVIAMDGTILTARLGLPMRTLLKPQLGIGKKRRALFTERSSISIIRVITAAINPNHIPDNRYLSLDFTLHIFFYRLRSSSSPKLP